MGQGKKGHTKVVNQNRVSMEGRVRFHFSQKKKQAKTGGMYESHFWSRTPSSLRGKKGDEPIIKGECEKGTAAFKKGFMHCTDQQKEKRQKKFGINRLS